MEASILQSCSVLEEYLQEDYVSVVGSEQDGSFDNSNVSLTPLEEMLKFRQNYFFKNGTYDYVIYEYEHDGKVDYLKIRLINKQNLSDEIKSQLKGGDAKGNSRESYLLFEDVFGVTDDLKVFYCSDGLEKSIGANFLNSSMFDSTKVLYSKTSPASKALAESYSIEERDLTISDLRSVNQLTISERSGASDLKFLIDMPNITKLTLKDYNGSLSGIEDLIDLTYLLIDNYENKTNINYEGLSGATTLSELDFYMPTDDEVEKMCQEMSKSDYLVLKTIKLSSYIQGLHDSNGNYIDSLRYLSTPIGARSNLSTLNSLMYLSTKTKKVVEKLYINNNRLTSLDGIQDFSGITYLNLQNNRIMNEDNEDRTKFVGIGDYLENMNNLTNLYCGFCNIQDEDFSKISNENIQTLSIAGNTNIKSLSVLKKFKELKSLQAKGNDGFDLNNELIDLIISLENYYLDDVYATKLSLGKIGEEVWLGKGSDDDDIDILLNEDEETLLGIKKFEIPGCNSISGEKLQEILGKLKGLEVLIANSTNLDSLDFIKEGSKLKFINILNTKLTINCDLNVLSNCSELEGLCINIEGLNLRPYSDLISNMCRRNNSSCNGLVCGAQSFSGLVSTETILNTLNGTSKDDINESLTCFGSYSGSGSWNVVDFSFTNVENISRNLWFCATIKLPSCFNRFEAMECAQTTLDYSEVKSAEYYNAVQVQSRCYDSFNGYREIHTNSGTNVSSILGAYTNVLELGRCNYRTIKKSEINYDFSSIVEKAPNLTKLVIYGATGLNDISVFSPLHLESLSLNYSSIFGLEPNLSEDFEKMAKSLNTLTISNCSSFNDLNGLKKLRNIKTLDLSNDTSLENIQTIKELDGSIENIPTCKYIVNSLPDLERLTLKGCKITDFSYLTKNGFKETSNGVFEKN